MNATFSIILKILTPQFLEIDFVGGLIWSDGLTFISELQSLRLDTLIYWLIFLCCRWGIEVCGLFGCPVFLI